MPLLKPFKAVKELCGGRPPRLGALGAPKDAHEGKTRVERMDLSPAKLHELDVARKSSKSYR